MSFFLNHQGASPKPKDTIRNFLAWQEAGMDIMVELTDMLNQLDIEDMEDRHEGHDAQCGHAGTHGHVGHSRHDRLGGQTRSSVLS